MSLTAGARLGPYEVVGAAGSGGMGDVYRARDVRLDRTVAIKVLPPHLAGDREFHERFDREARTLSQLTHANICTLYDVGEMPAEPHAPAAHFLVMEYLQGETLAARLSQGALPLADALRIAADIALALDTAHRHGIVHRDLKPANVMLTKSGAKLLDFGLATSCPAGAVAMLQTSEAPTVAAPLTAKGTILGTFQYMAPEQIEGREADARTDIFAFGVVLYEMLTGRKAFNGTNQASLLGVILKDEPPPLRDVQPVTPPALDYLVRICLAKDPDARFQSAHDVLLQLKWIGEGGSSARLSAPGVGSRMRRVHAIWAAGALVAGVLAAAAGWWLAPRPVERHPVTRFQFSLPDGQAFTRVGRHVLAISPDGTKLAYVADGQLYLRPMDGLDAHAIRGTSEDPMEPVFSPDGQSLAYFTPSGGAGAPEASWMLKKISTTGGAPVTLAQVASAPYGATWQNGTIAFGVNFDAVHGIQAVPDSGGTPRTLVSVDRTQELAAHPQLLDDGRHLLFVAMAVDGSRGDIVVQALDGTGRRVLVSAGTNPHLLPTGHLAYFQARTLLAVPFDTKRLVVTGGPVPLVEHVVESEITWSGQVAIAAAGTLAFWSGARGAEEDRNLVWVDRQGNDEPIAAPRGPYFFPRLSPDGRTVAISSAGGERDIWTFDLTKETLTRLTFGSTVEWYSPWTPDGKAVVFSSADDNSSIPDIFRKPADGTGAPLPITRNRSGGFPYSISPDGQWVVYRALLGGRFGLMVVRLDGSGQPRTLLADPKFSQANGEISPDGRWIAYDSNESGRSEVYVRPFPDVDGGRWQISAEGGSHPLWARHGRELLFRTTSSPNRLMSVPIQGEGRFRHDRPQRLFDLTGYVTTASGRQFDISPDGSRFVMLKPLSGEAPSIVVVSNWLDEVRTKMGGAP